MYLAFLPQSFKAEIQKQTSGSWAQTFTKHQTKALYSSFFSRDKWVLGVDLTMKHDMIYYGKKLGSKVLAVFRTVSSI